MKQEEMTKCWVKGFHSPVFNFIHCLALLLHSKLCRISQIWVADWAGPERMELQQLTGDRMRLLCCLVRWQKWNNALLQEKVTWTKTTFLRLFLFSLLSLLHIRTSLNPKTRPNDVHNSSPVEGIKHKVVQDLPLLLNCGHLNILLSGVFPLSCCRLKECLLLRGMRHSNWPTMVAYKWGGSICSSLFAMRKRCLTSLSNATSSMSGLRAFNTCRWWCSLVDCLAVQWQTTSLPPSSSPWNCSRGHKEVKWAWQVHHILILSSCTCREYMIRRCACCLLHSSISLYYSSLLSQFSSIKLILRNRHHQSQLAWAQHFSVRGHRWHYWHTHCWSCKVVAALDPSQITAFFAEVVKQTYIEVTYPLSVQCRAEAELSMNTVDWCTIALKKWRFGRIPATRLLTLVQSIRHIAPRSIEIPTITFQRIAATPSRDPNV